MVAVVPYFCGSFLLSIFAMYTNNIIMTPDTKEKIQYSTAVTMIVSAVVLAFICFFLNHYYLRDLARHQDQDRRGEERREAVCG